ncbi:MAG TPA: M48 family metallopeptidase [Anaeromyxobacteraceae bacterium]|nr:M48 family metallopeptidase [Anaeromyxobacteraceae bacterium]
MPSGRATLDFFAAQAAARRRTAVLVVACTLAVAATIAVVHAALWVALPGVPIAAGHGFWWPPLLGASAAGVLAVVAIGTAVELSGLREGGAALAERLGGVPVDPRADTAQQRLANVVEELSIAAGIPPPRTFVMPREAAVNAFAAGFSPDRAAVAVTRGALDALTREELQGVVAHELSHVVNGDARLSLQLVGVVGGLTILAQVGRVLLRPWGDVDGRTGRSRNPLVGVGLALLVAGAIGAFFARLVRFAVSREREYLADAASAQFTRNPGALASALVKVAQEGSAVGDPRAVEAAHLFFARAENGLLASLFSTHPPLEERIRRLAPHGVAAALAAAPPARPAPSAAAPGTPAAAATGLAQAAIAAIGRPGPGHVAAAAALLSALPPGLADAARSPRGAGAVVRALLLERGAEARDAQLLRAPLAPDVLADVRRVAPAVDAVPRPSRLSVLDLSLPALDTLAPAEARALTGDLAALAAAADRPTGFRWALQRVVRRRLAAQLGEKRAPLVRARTVEDVQVECLEVLSLLAWAGAANDAPAAQRALDAGVRALGAGAWRVLPPDRIGPARVDAALGALDAAAPPLKARVLGAAAACVLADGRVAANEAEILRAVSAAMGCPMPPLLAAEASPGAAAAS